MHSLTESVSSIKCFSKLNFLNASSNWHNFNVEWCQSTSDVCDAWLIVIYFVISIQRQFFSPTFSMLRVTKKNCILSARSVEHLLLLFVQKLCWHNKNGALKIHLQCTIKWNPFQSLHSCTFFQSNWNLIFIITVLNCGVIRWSIEKYWEKTFADGVQQIEWIHSFLTAQVVHFKLVLSNTKCSPYVGPNSFRFSYFIAMQAYWFSHKTTNYKSDLFEMNDLMRLNNLKQITVDTPWMRLCWIESKWYNLPLGSFNYE